MNKITITDEFGYKEDYSYLDGVLEYALSYLKIESVIFDIIFCDNDYIKKINKEYRNIDRVTDVISFAFEDNEEIVYNSERLLGEIYICIPRMLEQAIEYEHSPKRELSFLAVHGLLHLLGYDHMNEEDEKVMFKLQELILDGANIKRENKTEGI